MIWILELSLFEAATAAFAVQQELSKISFAVTDAGSRDTALQDHARRRHYRVPLIEKEIDVTNTSQI